MYSGFDPTYRAQATDPYTATGGEMTLPQVTSSNGLVFRNGLLMTYGYDYYVNSQYKVMLLTAATTGQKYHVVSLDAFRVANPVSEVVYTQIDGVKGAGQMMIARVIGGEATAFQWYRNGLAISGATSLYSQNHFLQSQTFENASWTKTNCTVTPAYSTAPDGTATGQRLQMNLGTDSITQTVTFGDVKVGDSFMMSIHTTSATLPLTFGTGTMAGATTSGSASVGSGWYRHWLKKVSSGAGSLSIQLTMTGPLDTSTWGAQLVRGSELTPYIRTTTTVAPGSMSVYYQTASDVNQLISVQATVSAVTATYQGE